MSETVLALARHGETDENARGRWQGRSDSPLSDRGRDQARALGARLGARGPHQAIYSSPLGRARETARLVAAVFGALSVETDPDLAEYDFGAWDQLTPAQLTARGFWTAVQRDPGFAPPGGEPFAAAATRGRARWPASPLATPASGSWW